MHVLDDEMLTVAEVAELLRVAQSTVRRWIREGDVPAYRIGKRRIVVRQADLSNVVVAARGTRPSGPEHARAPIVIPARSEEERERVRTVVDRIIERHRAFQAEGRNEYITPSWILINEARDERSEQLARF